MRLPNNTTHNHLFIPYATHTRIFISLFYPELAIANLVDLSSRVPPVISLPGVLLLPSSLAIQEDFPCGVFPEDFSRLLVKLETPLTN